MIPYGVKYVIKLALAILLSKILLYDLSQTKFNDSDPQSMLQATAWLILNTDPMTKALGDYIGATTTVLIGELSA